MTRTDIRTQKIAPAHPLPNDASFAELVCYHLPQETWIERKKYNHNYDRTTHTPATSVLDESHLKLLEELPAFKKPSQKRFLNAAWLEWLRLGKYSKGEDQRMTLYFMSVLWIVRRDLLEEIRVGHYGTPEQQDDFNIKWTDQGLREIKSDSEWKMWEEVLPLYESCSKPKRHQIGLMYDNVDYESRQLLGSPIFM